MKFRLLFFCFLVFNGLQAQVFHRQIVPVTEGGVEFPNPWAGGHNAPQWSKVDLNNDGKKDLYAFDRNGEVHVAYLNISQAGEAKYQFAPYLTRLFPRCGQFALLRDFDGDGVVDLFTQSFIETGLVGFRVFQGRFVGSTLAFDRIKFPDFDYDMLYYEYEGEFFEIKSENPDLPAVDDLDGDGDLDILALESGGGYVRYYQNMAHEMGYTNDTLIYSLGDACWGKFYLQPFSNQFILSCDAELCALDCLQEPPVKTEDRNGVHGGAALCTFDQEGDGDKEILYGDLIYQNLIFGLNGGDNESAYMDEQDAQFPTYNMPADISDFVSSFYFDYDNDGVNDVMASTNVHSGVFDYHVGWFYKNNGTNSDHDFALQGTDIMVRDMLDFGTGAHPAFVDYNADGLIDLVVANTNRWAPDFNQDPFLVLMENVGTATEPAFDVVDRNWLDFNQFTVIGSTAPYAFAPAFGDLDNDGDLDLVTGERNGSLFFVENMAGPGQPMAFGPIQPLWKNILVGQFSSPCIHDVNGDGKPDLIIGERNGNVNYFPNIGTLTEPDFHPNPDEAPNNRFFGEINTQVALTGYSAPTVLEFDGELQIVTGSELGMLQHHRIDPDKLDGGTFEQLDDALGGGLREGWNTRIAFTDLNGDEFLDAVIGNERGGLGIFTSPITIDGLVDAGEVEPEFGLDIFPNPAKNELNIQLEIEGVSRGSFRIINALGQFLASGQINSPTHKINLQNWGTGVYFLQIEMGAERAVRRFVKH